MACKGVSHHHSTTTFSENVVMAEGSFQMISNVRRFIILRSWGGGGGESLTSFNKKSSANISGEESTMKCSIPGYLFFDNTQKNLKSNISDSSTDSRYTVE